MISTAGSLLLLLLSVFTTGYAALYPGGADQGAGSSGAPTGLSQGWMPSANTNPSAAGTRAPVSGFPAVSREHLQSLVQNFNKLNVPGDPFLPRPAPTNQLPNERELPAPERKVDSRPSSPTRAGPAGNKQSATSYLQALQALQRQFKSVFPPIQSPPNNNNFPPPPSPTGPKPPQIPNPSWQPKPPNRMPQWQPRPSPPLPPRLPPQPRPSPPRPSQPRQPPMPSSPFLPGPSVNQSPAQKAFAAPAQSAYVPPPYMMAYGGSNECSGGYVPGQLCCDGIVNPTPAGGPGTWGCCHKGIYNMKTQVCCGDVPVPKPTTGPPKLCCGMTLYDPRTQICCDKFPMPNQGGALKCCRKNAFNPVTQMCCGESVKPRPPNQKNMDCCGKHMYNPLTHICCEEGNAFLKTPGAQCCGKNTFQPAVQQCCFGDALPKGTFCMAK